MTCVPNRPTRLLVRPEPFKYEGLRGFMLRLAECNALSSVVDLYRLSFGAPDRRAIEPATLQAAESKLGLPDFTLRRLAISSVPGDRQRRMFLGHTLEARHLRKAQCAVCPPCLAQLSAARADWELQGQVACGHHGCWLIDRCSGCKASIRWRRTGVRMCSCGQDLALLPTASAPPKICHLAQAICARLFGALAQEPWPSSFCAEMERSTLSQLLCVSQLLDSRRFGAPRPHVAPKAGWTKEMARQVSVASLTAAALSHWPTGWRTLIDRTMAGGRKLPPPGGGRYIVGRARWASKVHPMLNPRSSSEKSVPGPLRTEFHEHMARRTVEIHVSRFFTLGSVPPAKSRDHKRLPLAPAFYDKSLTDQDWISKEVMQDLLGASEEQLVAISSAGLIGCMDGWYSAKGLRDVSDLLQHASEELFRAPKRRFHALDEMSGGIDGELAQTLRQVKAGRLRLYRTGTARPMRLAQLLLAKLDGEKGPAREPIPVWSW